MTTRSTPRRRLVVGAGAAALAALGGCASSAFVAAPEGPIAPPRARVGDRWRYRETNRYNGQVTAEILAECIAAEPFVRVRFKPDRGRAWADELCDDAWRVRQEPHYDQTQLFERPVPVIGARIEAGHQEELRTTYRVDGVNGRFAWLQQLRHVGWEAVEVPAGRFVALRCERRIWFAHTDSFRLNPLRFDTAWYAPQVGRWVRREWTGEFTLGGWRGASAREDWVAWELIA